MGLSRKQGWAKPLGYGVALYAMGMAVMELLAIFTVAHPVNALMLPLLWGGTSLSFLVLLARSSDGPHG